MTTVTHKHTTKKHYIFIEQENTLLYVRVCTLLGDSLASYPIQQAIYHYTEQDKAIRTYKRYIKKYAEV